MPTIRLTKRTIDAIPVPESGQVLYRDTALPGFGLRVGKRARTFFVEGQIRRRTVRTTVGRYGLVTLEEARAQAKQIQLNISKGRNPNAEKAAERARAITLKQAFDGLFAGRPFAASSLQSYRASINVHLADWSSIPVGEITRQMVMDRYKKLQAEKGANSATSVMRHLRSAYNFTMVTHGDLPPNPVNVLTQAKAWAQTKRRQTLVADHLLPQWFRAVLQADEIVRDFLLVALFTGMRRSEVARLRWENIDFDARALTVPRTKNGDPLQLPLSNFLLNLLLTRRELHPDADWVFPGNGERGHIVETKRFYGRVERAGGVPFTLHDLRRTFVTTAESLDIPAYTLKRLLNHRTDRDVTGGYIVITVERLRKPVERIAQRLLELAKRDADGQEPEGCDDGEPR
jgi:integrase